MQDGEGTGRLQMSKDRNEGRAPSLDGSAAAPLPGLALLEPGVMAQTWSIPARVQLLSPGQFTPHLYKTVERGVEMWE